MIKHYCLIDGEELAEHLKTLVDRHTAISASLNGDESPDASERRTLHAAKSEAYENVIGMVLRRTNEHHSTHHR